MKRFAIAIFISWVGLLVALLLLPSLPLSTHFTEQIDYHSCTITGSMVGCSRMDIACNRNNLGMVIG